MRTTDSTDRPTPCVPDTAELIEFARLTAKTSLDAAVIVVGPERQVLFADGERLDRAGVTARALVGLGLSELTSLTSAPRALLKRWECALRGAVQRFEHRTADGRRAFRVQMTPVVIGSTDRLAVVGLIYEITDQEHIRSELIAERARLGAAERQLGFGQWSLEVSSGMLALSDGARRLLGCRDQDRLALANVLGRVDTNVRSRLTHVALDDDDGALEPCEWSLRADDGTMRRLMTYVERKVASDGRTVVSGTTIDVTGLRTAERARTRAETLLQQAFEGAPIGMATTHPVTGRYLLVNDALCAFLGRSRTELLSLTTADVRHPADALLDEASRQEVREGKRANFMLEQRYVRSDGEIVWGGVHVVPAYGDSGEIRAFLSQIVDLTAHKQREQQLVQEVAELERLKIVQAAIASDRLVLHAQPIIALDSQQIVQQELLVRLQLEDGTILPPGEFLPIAEAHGCIRDIDRWVTERAIELAAGGDPVEVNLSASSVGDDRLLDTIQMALARTGADPSCIVFEVTETAVVADITRGREFARALHALGCRFALDDFGTGYGTFTYLRHFPIDYVKIDVDFVRELVRSESDYQIVKAIVMMAKGLGKRTVAEGVEDAATLESLQALGVDLAQGYFIGRPAPLVDAGRPPGPSAA